MKILKKVQYYVLFAMIGAIGLSSCQKEDVGLEDLNKDQGVKEQSKPRFLKNTMQDQDGNTYGTVQIGNQIWMVENLRTTTYRDGSPITYGRFDSEWSQATTGMYCGVDGSHYPNPPYGFYYNWYAVDSEKGLAPEGWRIPTIEDWHELFNNYGNYQTCGDELKEVGTAHWNVNDGATNESGFTLVGNGQRQSYGGFSLFKDYASLWSSSLNVNGDAGTSVGCGQWSSFGFGNPDPRMGFGVRCIKNVEIDPSSCIDGNGNEYNTVRIGDKIWSTENCRATKYMDGTDIPHLTSNSAWASDRTGAYCIYENDPANIQKYGRLYNYHAVVNPSRLAPDGWRIATSSDWLDIINETGGIDAAAGELKEPGTTYWEYPNYTTEASGMNLRPGAYRNKYGTYSIGAKNKYGYWWTTTSTSSSNAFYFYAYNSSYKMYSRALEKENGFSVRFVRNVDPEPLPDPGSETCTDGNGNVYNTVNIGGKIWTTENCKATKYMDGTNILYKPNSSDWQTDGSGAYCYYENDPSNVQKYGMLYNFHSVINSRKLAPPGWHVATYDDWQHLISEQGGTYAAAGKLKEPGTTYWESPNHTSEPASGINLRPGAYRNQYGTYSTGAKNKYGYWWTTRSYSGNAYYFYTYNSTYTMYNRSINNRCGFSVRFVKD